MATPSGKAIDAAYLLNQLKAYDTKVATVKYNEKFQVSTMPTADVNYLGKYFQYVGVTDATYTNGYFYTCILEDSSYKWIKVQQAAPEYTIKKLSTPSSDEFSATFRLTKDGVEVGDVIDIPKEFFITDAKTGVVTITDKASGGKFENDERFVIDDTYIELDVSLKDKTEPKPVYINVTNLVDVYVAGDGVKVTDGARSKVIGAKLTTNGGLKFGALEDSDTEKGVAIDFETTNIDFNTQW